VPIVPLISEARVKAFGLTTSFEPFFVHCSNTALNFECGWLAGHRGSSWFPLHQSAAAPQGLSDTLLNPGPGAHSITSGAEKNLSGSLVTKVVHCPQKCIPMQRRIERQRIA
jgi:hypothetical protein